KRKKAELAADGKPAGGGRAFCFEPDGVTIRKGEATAYRRAARHALAGKSTTAIAKEGNAAGLRTPKRHGLWTQTMVRMVLTSPGDAGLRSHNGGFAREAVWPGVIDRATHEALVAMLTKGAKKNPRRRSLLTGLVRCGACGTQMGRDGRSFRCRPSNTYPDACGHVQIRAAALERLVEGGMVVQLLDSPKLMQATMRNQERDHAAHDALALEVTQA